MDKYRTKRKKPEGYYKYVGWNLEVSRHHREARIHIFNFIVYRTYILLCIWLVLFSIFILSIKNLHAWKLHA